MRKLRHQPVSGSHTVLPAPGSRISPAVAKAVMLKARLVIMDEPTAALGVSQTALVLDMIRHLADQGIAVIMISHNLTDVFKVADRIAVLYLGRLATVGPAPDFDTATAVHWMTAGTSPDGRLPRKVAS